MNDLAAHSRTRTEAASHLFRIGQLVRMKSRFGAPPRTAEIYRVTGTMPARDNSPQYRIRNDEERHERVASEDSLESVEPSHDEETLIERTFGNGQGTEAQRPRTTEAEAGKGSGQS